MKTEEKLNMTMLCDFYELTMGNGYFQTGFKDRITYFDVYFRSVPDGGGFAIAAGLEQLIEYIEDLHFELNEDSISFPWFSELPEPDEVHAYSALIAALCKISKEQKRITASEKEVENEKRILLIAAAAA